MPSPTTILSLLAFCLTLSQAQTESFRPPAPFASFKTVTNSNYPFVLGHRGSPYLRPEHTIPSYTLGIEQVGGPLSSLYVFCRFDGRLAG